MPVKTIGVAGTAKNTGKTTTLSFLLERALGDGLLPAITSIGYDGEAIDNITGLPKPRLRVTPGVLVATAERCLPAGTATLHPLESTPIETPLGPVILARVQASGLVVLAGPNKTSDLERLLQSLRPLNPGLILVDGALGRMAPLQATDGLIVAQGAALYPDLGRLVAHTRALAGLFSVPALDPGANPSAPRPRNNGFLTLDDLKRQVSLNWETKKIVLENSIKLVLSGPVEEVWAYLSAVRQQGIEVFVRQRVPLLAFTVNPFYPKWVKENRLYREEFLPAESLYEAIRAAVPVPVFDVKKDGAALWTLVKSFLS